MGNTTTTHICGCIAVLRILYHEVSSLNGQFSKAKRGEAFKTQTLKNIAKRYEWSRTTEEDVVQDKLSYDAPYTNLSASTFISENAIALQGKNASNCSDLRSSCSVQPAFIGFGERYATVPLSRLVPSRTPTSRTPPNYIHLHPTYPPSRPLSSRSQCNSHYFWMRSNRPLAS